MLLENVRSLCKSRGTSIWKLENILSIGNGCIVRWAKGSANMCNLIKVANYFDVSIDYLLGRECNLFSADGQMVAVSFDALSTAKQDLVKQYINLLQAEENKKGV